MSYGYHSNLFSAFVWVSTYIYILLASISIATTLYYLAELAEEFSSLAKIFVKYALFIVLGSHLLLMVFDDTMPFFNMMISMLCQAVYASMFATFPVAVVTSPAFISSCVALIVSHVTWYWHFQDMHYMFTPVEVMAFFLVFVWIVPFSLFVSVSIGDSSLPTAGASSGASSGKSFSLKSAFAFFRNMTSPTQHTILPVNISESTESISDDLASAPYVPVAAATQYAHAAVSEDEGLASRYAQPIAQPAPMSYTAPSMSMNMAPMAPMAPLSAAPRPLMRSGLARPAPIPGKAD